jgi:hypothetical protein
MSRHYKIWLVGSLILTLALASACSRGASEEDLLLGSDNTLSGEAVLICGQDCSDRALCGLVDEEKTVLLNSSSPSTINHDYSIPSGTKVSIDHQEMHPVIQVSDQSSFRAPFYQIFLEDGRSGWVSGWCIGQ